MITAKIIADSVSAHTGQRITTFELEYPRFIHAEFMTHRQFSRNAASSRAIPIAKMIELVKENPAMPIHWGKNQSGMQANEQLPYDDITEAMDTWLWSCGNSIIAVNMLNELGLHKQVANRLLEPFQNIKVVCTATSYDNFFHLRYHKDAQPEIQELARKMYQHLQISKPQELSYGEWHLPYVASMRDEKGQLLYFTYLDDGFRQFLTLEQAQKISCSCCAQVSYRKTDDSLEKAIAIYDKLVNSQPVHASAFEHCATPTDIFKYSLIDTNSLLEDGITGLSYGEKCSLISGNFTNWIQYRQLIKDHDCKEFKKELNA